MHPKLRYFLCGLAMGAADTVPGVSGGTIAFITGIYEELLNAIKSVNLKFFKYFFKGELKNAFSLIPWGFCIPLLFGIGVAIMSLAHLVVAIMATQPYLIWAFFFGLILASLYILMKDVLQAQGNTILSVFFGVLGFIFTVWLTNFNPMDLSHSYPIIFMSGFVAICAMILPGISGAFVLVLLGQYHFILQSVTQFKVFIIITFLCGCVCGLLSFAHIISACLQRFYKITLSFLSGVLAGSLIFLFPFTSKNSSEILVSPLLLCALIVLGFIIPLGLHILSSRKVL